MAHEILLLDERIGSKKSFFPYSVFSLVIGLSFGAGATSGKALIFICLCRSIVALLLLRNRTNNSGSKNAIINFSEVIIISCFNIDDTKMRSVQMRFLTLKDNLLILYAKMEFSGIFLNSEGLRLVHFLKARLKAPCSEKPLKTASYSTSCLGLDKPKNKSL